MGGPSIDPATLDAEIASLPELGITELRTRWHALYGRPAPKSFRRNLLARGVAYQMQVEVYGGLSKETIRRLREIALALRNGDKDVMASPRIKPGTRLLRLWQNKTHSVLVLNDSYRWEGKVYKSLSAIAKAITGTQWNGYTFFGLKRQTSRSRQSDEDKRRRG
jgi:hypothetical protein